MCLHILSSVCQEFRILLHHLGGACRSRTRNAGFPDMTAFKAVGLATCPNAPDSLSFEPRHLPSDGVRFLLKLFLSLEMLVRRRIVFVRLLTVGTKLNIHLTVDLFEFLGQLFDALRCHSLVAVPYLRAAIVSVTHAAPFLSKHYSED